MSKTRTRRIATHLSLLALVGALLQSPASYARSEPKADWVLAADLGALAFMAGTWTGRDGDVDMEEHWLAPKGGALLGLHRDLRGGRMVGFEFMRIEAGPDGIVFYGSPQGAPPTPFRMIESGDRRVVFGNPQHDYPQKIHYWLDAGGALHARIEGAAGADPREWTWQPAVSLPPAR